MKRSIAGVIAAVLGVGVALIAYAAPLLGARDLRFDWPVPLVAGGTVGFLSWFLVSATPSTFDDDGVRTVVQCATCGAEVLEEWRLCPHCGGAKPATADGGSHSAL
jgi:hypothetical protein